MGQPSASSERTRRRRRPGYREATAGSRLQHFEHSGLIVGFKGPDLEPAVESYGARRHGEPRIDQGGEELSRDRTRRGSRR